MTFGLPSISYKRQVMKKEYFAMSTHKGTRGGPSALSPLLKRGGMGDKYLATLNCLD